jgi:N-acetylneuraminic acid mutarotase
MLEKQSKLEKWIIPHLLLFNTKLPATSSEYHHYKDLWKFDVTTLKWTEIKARNPPSARSGHSCFLWKSYMIIFGGFFEAARETKFYSDLHVFNLQSEQWMAFPASRLATKPEPRSACNLALFGDKAIIHGGFTKFKAPNSVTETKVHTDAWVLVSACSMVQFLYIYIGISYYVSCTISVF